jgi:hypothetical protein
VLWIADLPDAGTLTQYVQYGVLGLVVVAFLSGWIWAKPAVDAMRKDLEETKAELRVLQTFNRDVVVPAIVKSNEAINATNELIRDLAAPKIMKPRP